MLSGPIRPGTILAGKALGSFLTGVASLFVLIVATTLMLGADWGPPPGVALIVGFGLALSSTAFVLRILSEQRALSTHYGRNSFAVLLLQDLAVVPLIALVPLLSAGEMSLGAEFGLAIVEGIVILSVVIFGVRLLLRPVLRRIAETGDSDIFAATAVLLVLWTLMLVAWYLFGVPLGPV